MLKYYRNLKKGNAGSMPVALFLTIMFLTLSVAIASVVASSIAQNRLEDNTRIGEWALTSAIAQAGEKVGPSAQALMNVATSEPATWSALAVNNSNSFSRWWVSSSANAVVNPSIIPAGTWSTATYGNNTWVAIDSLGKAYTSPDGTNWVARNSLPNAGTVNYKLSYGLGYFIALPTTASASVVTSADGVTWSTATLPASSTYTSACSSTTCLFLSLTSATGYYSTNLTSFTTTGALPFTPESVAFSVNAFVMSGNNAIANSNTGTSWSTQSISAHNWGLVNAINGTFTAFTVSATGSNVISTSSDGGNTWTDHSLPMSGNWIGVATSGTQEAAYSGSISGVAQSTYVYSSDGLTWVTGSLLVATAWTGAAASTNGFLVYSSSTATAYFIPVTSTASANKTLTVSARVQAGRVTGSNNAQYLASMVYSWNTSKKQWIASKYLGSSSASLSAISGAPTGVTGSRTSSGTIIVSWVAPVSTGSSSITSYVATASAGGYYCSSGQLNGTTCNTVSTYSATHNVAYYSCTTGDSPGGSQASNFTCSHSSTYASAYTAGSYTCTSGDTPTGSQTTPFTCTHTITYSANYQPATYTCTSGDSPSGVRASSFTCTHAATYASNYTPGAYTCTSGDTPTGTQTSAFTCSHAATYASNYTAPTYTCTGGDSPSGVQASSFTCTHYIGGASYAAPTYSCTSGDTPSGSQGSAFTCTKTSTSTYSSPLVSAAYYSCSSGTLSGSNCLTTYVAPNPCVSGYSYSAGTCTDPNVGAATHSVWSCPGGSGLWYGAWYGGAPDWYGPGSDALGSNGVQQGAYAQGMCLPAATYQIGISNQSTGACPGGYSAQRFNSGLNPPSQPYPGHSSQGSNSPYQYYGYCYENSYSATATPNYSCNSGASLSGSTCSYAATYNAGYYYCPSGGSLSGSTCTTTGSYAASYSAGTYSCPSGGSLSGSTCTTSYAASYQGYYCTSGTLTYNSGSYYCTLPAQTTSPSYSAAYCTTNAYANSSNCYSVYGGTWVSAYYSCPSGYSPTGHVSSGTTCTTGGGTAAASGNYYYCPSGGTLSGTSCLSSYAASYSAAYYYCPSGGSLSGSTCNTSSSYAASYSAGYYNCPSGGSLSGSTCSYTANILSYTYSCPSGGNVSGSTCSVSPPFVATDTLNYCAYLNNGHFVYAGSAYSPTLTPGSGYCQAQYSSSYNCGSNINNGDGTCTQTVPATYNPAVYQCTSGDSPSGTQSSAFTCTHTTTSTYTSPQTGGGYYYCSSGTLSGTSCYSYYASPMTAGYYYCTSGDTPSGTQVSSFTCTHTTTYTSPGTAAYYSCTSGDTPSGTQASSFTCTHLTTYASPMTAGYYYCTSGDTPSGNQASSFTCTNTTTYTSSGIPAYYSCTSGDSPSGTQSSSFTCTHTATYNSNLTPANYSCASGTLAGNLCLVSNAGTQALYNSGNYTCLSPSVLNCTITNMATGYYTFTVVASNGVGASPSSVASAGVQSQPSVISYPSSVFSTGQYNQTLSPLVTNTSGGSLSYSESGSMASGVTFNNSTGVITGPASWGSTAGYPFTISVSVTDAGTGITTTTPITFTLVIP